MPLDPKKVRARREALGLTKTAAAALLDIDRPNYDRLEAGRHSPNLKTVEKLAKAFKVPLEKLLTEKEGAEEIRK